MSRRFLVVLLLLVAWRVTGESFPPDGFHPGWTRSGDLLAFAPEALFNHINGGAELFLELGFRRLEVQKYAGDGGEIAVEAYRMESPVAAMAIYLIKASPETPLPGIALRHSGDRYQIAMVKGDFFVFINNFSGREELLPVMIALAQKFSETIPAAEAVAGLDRLPEENQVPGTLRLVRGPYSLQSVYTLGEGDVLMQEGRRFGICATYANAGKKHHVRIVVPYEDNAVARKALAHLRLNLDPYYRVVSEGGNFFVFRDFQERFGLVEISGSTIEIRAGLPEEPPPPTQ